MKKCHYCKQPFSPSNSLQKCCCPECAIAYVRAENEKKAKKEKQQQIQREKEERRVLRVRKLALRTRADWFDILQAEVNRYVRLRDSNEPCCTCGTTNPLIKYDAGHYRTRGACPELRFELTNIHKQCSNNCNQHGSGRRVEYQQFLRQKYGQDHLDWLDGPHPSLKEQFPTIGSIQKEISRYRQLNKTLKKEIEENQSLTECY